MGACYSRRSGVAAEAYSSAAYIRPGSPARSRKAAAMKRATPYTRVGRQQSCSGVGSRRTSNSQLPRRGSTSSSAAAAASSVVSPAPVTASISRLPVSRTGGRRGSSAGGRLRLTSSSSSVTSATAPRGDSNGNRCVSSAVPVPVKLNDSGLGTLAGSVAASGECDGGEGREVVEDDDDGGGDIRVGISTAGATIALSVNLHRHPGGSAAVTTASVTAGSRGQQQAQTVGEGRPRVLLSRPQVTVSTQAKPSSDSSRRAQNESGVGSSSSFSAAPRAPRTSLHPSCEIQKTVRRSATSVSAAAASSLPSTSSAAAELSHSVQCPSSLPTAAARQQLQQRPLAATATMSCLPTPRSAVPYRHYLSSTVQSRVSLWEEKSQQLRGAPRLSQLRREMRRLTRDVATSPLHRPAAAASSALLPPVMRDSSTLTEPQPLCRVVSPPLLLPLHSSTPAAGAAASSERYRLDAAEYLTVDVKDTPRTSAVSSTDASADFIDDEIGDQPQLGGEAPDLLSSLGTTLSPAVWSADFTGGGSAKSEERYLLGRPERPGEEESPYVRPFRLTPRPLATITAPLETPPTSTDVTPSVRRLHQHQHQLSRRLKLEHDVIQESCFEPDVVDSDADTDADGFDGGGGASARLGLPAAGTSHLSDRLSSLCVDSGPMSLPVLPEYHRAQLPARRTTSLETGSMSDDNGNNCVMSPLSRNTSMDVVDAILAETDDEAASTLFSRRHKLSSADSGEGRGRGSPLSIGGCVRRQRPLSAEMGALSSPCDSLVSDDLTMADLEQRSAGIGVESEDDTASLGNYAGSSWMPLRRESTQSTDSTRPSYDPHGTASRILKPPRQSSGQDDVEWLLIDRDTYMYMAQDCTHTKTMLHKLRRLLQASGTTIPLEQSLHSPSRLNSVSSADSPTFSSLEGRRNVDGGADLVEENCELRRQVMALQQELDDRSRTVRMLQQQLTKYSTAGVDSIRSPTRPSANT